VPIVIVVLCLVLLRQLGRRAGRFFFLCKHRRRHRERARRCYERSVAP
jgi:hypothetical protein